ncbi:hypothetical protein JCM16303_005919 [Sporobolomyces ruberrimus]
MTSTRPDSFPPSSSTSGDCAVCGNSCTTRCSACATNGCDWMFFCSTEHQKLVWHTHKRVCGVNAAPFQWPSFTESEAMNAKSLLLAEIEFRQSRGEGLGGLLGSDGRTTMTIPEIKVAIDVVTEGSTLAYRYPYERHILAARLRKQFFTLEIIRNGEVKKRSINSADMMASISKDPFGALARFLDNFQSIYAKIIPAPSLMDSLLHKLLAHFSLLASYYKDTSKIDQYRSLLRYTKEEVLRYCREVVKFFRPDLACTIEIDLVHSFTKGTYQPLLETTGQYSVWKPV